jgi:hypothetical protein
MLFWKLLIETTVLIVVFVTVGEVLAGALDRRNKRKRAQGG